MDGVNFWGMNPDNLKEEPKLEIKPQADVVDEQIGEIDKVEAITEGDRIRARAEVASGRAEMYLVKTPPDINLVETRPSGDGKILEVVYHGIVYGYTNDRNFLHRSPEKRTLH